MNPKCTAAHDNARQFRRRGYFVAAALLLGAAAIVVRALDLQLRPVHPVEHFAIATETDLKIVQA